MKKTLKIYKYQDFLSSDALFLPQTFSQIGNFFAAVGAVILNQKNEVLLTQRSKLSPKSPKAWEIMFGRVNKGENFERALLREADEELGIKIQPIRIISTMHFTRTKEEPEHIGIIYLCRIQPKQTIKIDPTEIAAYQWLSMDKAIQKVADYTKPHLEWVVENAICKAECLN
jgi:8-oxo-dGTP pyrophosphatase MutT (NUDIX family)